jgi:hypothetical protein
MVRSVVGGRGERGEKLSMWTEFVFGGHHFDGILVAAEGRGGCIFYTIYTDSILTSQITVFLH